MSYIKSFLFWPIVLVVFLTSNLYSQGWQQKNNFSGGQKAYAFSFVIGTKAYVGTGLNNTYSVTSDFWEYNPTTDVWTQKALFIGQARYGAAAFAIGTKGYVGTGSNALQIGTNNFYEYDAVSNLWTAKASLGTNMRFDGVAFSIGTKGYMGLGRHNTTFRNDFWEYNPANNRWTQRANYPAGTCAGAIGFAIGTKGYVGLGYNQSTLYKVFYEYNPTTNVWTKKADLPSHARFGASSFVLNAKGYALLGSSNTKDVWEYNPTTNVWKQKMNFVGTPRSYATAFSLNSKGYLMLGLYNGTFKNEVWEYSSDSCWISAIAIPHTTPNLCLVDSVLLSANTDSGLTYQWQRNGIDLLGDTNKLFYADTVGLYTVRISGKNICSNTSIAVNVTKPCVGSATTANAGPDKIACVGSFAALSGSIGGAASMGTWSGGAGVYNPNNTTLNATYTPTAAERAIGFVKLCLTTDDPDGAGPLVAARDTMVVINRTAPASPSSIFGTAGFCASSTGNAYSVNNISGAAFTWQGPTGATLSTGQGTNSVTISFANNAASGNITVSASNSCGTSATVSRAITLRSALPSMPGTITGSTNGCPGETKTFTIRKVSNSDRYIWTPPTGATINGSSAAYSTTDTLVNVVFTAAFAGDTLKVRSSTCFGVSANRTLRINKSAPAQPGTITGPVAGLCNKTAIVFSIAAVTNASTYTWRTNIAGATINGSATAVTTSSLNVSMNFGTFTSGIIYVKSNNLCGSSIERSLTVNSIPAIPASVTGVTTVCKGQLGVAYSTPAVTYAAGYNWGTSTGSTIASGQNTVAVTANFSNTAGAGFVRVQSVSACGSSSYRTLNVTISNCPRLLDEQNDNKALSVVAYPIPAHDKVTVLVLSPTVENYHLEVMDLYGRIAYSQDYILTEGENQILLDLTHLSLSNYILNVRSDTQGKQLKLLLQ